MSRKHNVKHPERSKSHYPARLSARGLSKAPTMTDLETLQKLHTRRTRETCTVGPEHDHHECNGVPWPGGGRSVESNAEFDNYGQDVAAEDLAYLDSYQ